MMVIRSVSCWEVKKDEDRYISTWFSHMGVIKCIEFVGAEVTLKSAEEYIYEVKEIKSKYAKFYKGQDGVGWLGGSFG